MYICLKFRSNYEVAELTWENGHLAMHELGTILPTAQTKTTWDGTGETLESIVNQATSHSQNINLAKNDHHQNHLGSTSSIAKSYNVKCGENLSHLEMAPGFANKRVRSEYSDQERADRSACASASATFCRDNDTTMMTWASLESPRSLKTEFVVEDSACHDGSVDSKFPQVLQHPLRYLYIWCLLTKKTSILKLENFQVPKKVF